MWTDLWHLLCCCFGCHDFMTAYTADRIFMRCNHCRKVTLGWAVAAAQTSRPSCRVWDRSDYREAYVEFLDCELALHGGG